MTNDEKKKLYTALAAPFPESCIQRTDGRLTGKGYSTSGIGYQFIVNRLNEVLGVGCFRAHRTMTIKEITRSNGRPAVECVCDLTLEIGAFIDGQWVMIGEALADGSHQSSTEGDARKGAYTNAFKKAAAFFGVGKQAYEGTLDDDNVPGEIESTVAPVMSVVRAPVPQVAHQAPSTASGYTSPPAAQNAGPHGGPPRNRLSSKQLSAIWSIARKLGHEQGSFRSKVKAEFGKALEFLSKDEASALITRLNAHLNGNGSGHEVEQPESVA